MQLPGRLARTTLGDLLGRLHRANASGALELSIVGPPSQRHRIFFHRGLIAGLELDGIAPSRIGEVLVGEGLAPLHEVARALTSQQNLGASAPKHGEILVKRGIVSAEVRDAALRKQARSRLEMLFARLDGRDGEIRFHVGVSASTAAHKLVAPLLPREFLLGRRRTRVQKREASDGPTPRKRDFLTLDRLRALRLLGVPLEADETVIRRAFRNAAMRIHPDRHPSAPASERARLHAELAELSAAYHLLCA